MNSHDLANIIETLIQKNLSKDVFRLAEVTALSSLGVRVQFDGETIASTKYYPIVGSASILRVGDRVLMVRVKGSYAVIGRVASGAASMYSGFAKVYTGDSNGDGVTFGMGGLTVIGGGEAAINLIEFLQNYGNEQLHLASDNNVFIATDMQAGAANRYEWAFTDTGYLKHPKYKYSNGYNMIANRANAATDSLLLMQSVTGAGINLASGEAFDFTNITFPVAFDSTPEWAVVCGRDANSAHAHFAVYNLTTTGCTIYATRLPSTASTSNYNPMWQLVVCGTRAAT